MNYEIVKVGPIVITRAPVDVILLRGPLEGPGPKARLEGNEG